MLTSEDKVVGVGVGEERHGVVDLNLRSRRGAIVSVQMVRAPRAVAMKVENVGSWAIEGKEGGLAL